jgi:hypothetical protein
MTVGSDLHRHWRASCSSTRLVNTPLQVNLVPFAIIHVLGFAAALLSPGPAVAQAQLPSSTRSEAAPVLVIGFMGGFVRTDDFHHSDVQLARQLQVTYSDSVAQKRPGQETAVRSASSSSRI